MTGFTPVASLIGGALIGVAACVLLLAHGRIAGISGILGGVARALPGDRSWRHLFVAGLVAGGALVASVAPSALDATSDRPLAAIAVAGVLVGVGTRYGNGCTSGHGVCGLGRFSFRSLVATCVFMTTGVIAALATRLALGRIS